MSAYLRPPYSHTIILVSYSSSAHSRITSELGKQRLVHTGIPNPFCGQKIIEFWYADDSLIFNTATGLKFASTEIQPLKDGDRGSHSHFLDHKHPTRTTRVKALWMSRFVHSTKMRISIKSFIFLHNMYGVMYVKGRMIIKDVIWALSFLQ